MPAAEVSFRFTEQYSDLVVSIEDLHKNKNNRHFSYGRKIVRFTLVEGSYLFPTRPPVGLGMMTFNIWGRDLGSWAVLDPATLH